MATPRQVLNDLNGWAKTLTRRQQKMQADAFRRGAHELEAALDRIAELEHHLKEMERANG